MDNKCSHSSGITWADTKSRLAADRQRWKDQSGGRSIGPISLQPGFVAILLHRLSHYFYQRQNRVIARVLWHLNVLLTGADIAPITSLGAGCLISHPAAVIFVGQAGERLTILGPVGVGGGVSDLDIGAGPGLPVFGDGVTLGFGCGVLGPINIGSDVVIGHHCLVTADLEVGSVVSQAPSSVNVTARSAEIH